MAVHQEGVEKHLSLGIEKANKEIERLKYDLIDILENKHEVLLAKFNSELQNIREKYDDATKNVKAAGNELGTMFVEKVGKIKETCSTFFARADFKIDECNRDTVAIGNLLRGF